jgi:hypothetical protein
MTASCASTSGDVDGRLRRRSGEAARVTTATPVTIYTDGACSGNPGPGGWGAILRFGEAEKELCGGEATPPTTAWS